MSVSLPLAYIILGTPGAGRRAVLADLIADGLDTGDRAVTFLSADESSDPLDEKLGHLVRWRWENGTIAAEVPESIADQGSGGERRFSHVFFLTDGRLSPVDQIEALKTWLDQLDVEFARAITVIDCSLAARQPALAPWFDACVHFSDVVLLARREGVPNKWMSDFQARYRDKFIPALFEFVKEGRVRNPAQILQPEARRVTHVFDEDSDWTVARKLAPEAEFEDSGDAGDDSGGGDMDAGPDIEPYFERRQNGHRTIELPDVRKYLPKPGETSPEGGSGDGKGEK